MESFLKAGEIFSKREEGMRYELRAKEYLLRLGYQFIAQNVNFRSGEIDLIFEQALTKSKIELVFVEVRKKSEAGWISAEESVTFPKQRRIKSAIAQYLLRYPGRAKSIRIDLVAFQGERIQHFPNFFS